MSLYIHSGQIDKATIKHANYTYKFSSRTLEHQHETAPLPFDLV
jgi:hypothetical protein